MQVRVIIANCELSLSRGDTDVALSYLRAVPKDSPQFVKAKVAMADILLKHRKDRGAYAQCYAELADR
jgi:tetratricopeptide repeat protein 21B